LKKISVCSTQVLKQSTEEEEEEEDKLHTPKSSWVVRGGGFIHMESTHQAPSLLITKPNTYPYVFLRVREWNPHIEHHPC